MFKSLLLGLILSLASFSVTYDNNKTLQYETKVVDEEEIMNDLPQSDSPIFYISSNIGLSNYFIEDDIINLKTLGKYNFKVNDTIYEGSFIGSNLTSFEDVNNEIESVMNSIENNSYFDYNQNFKESNVIYDGLWEYVSDKKNIYLCDDKEHFGKATEWENVRKIYSKDLKSHLFSITTQLYLLPNQENHSFRTDGAIIDIDILNEKLVDVRDYEPKTNPVSRNVSYGFSFGSTINNEGIEGSSGLNVNYNIIEQSPQIKSLGSIADNNTSIYFDYINAHHNKGDFYNYSTTETYQCTTTLIKAELGAESLRYNIQRTFEFFKDGFWSNYFRQFKYKDERKFII